MKQTIDLDAGIFMGVIECLVEYDYSPAEPCSCGEPAVDEFYEILSITSNGIDITKLVDDEEAIINLIKEARND
jgi:hypothetical protein